MSERSRWTCCTVAWGLWCLCHPTALAGLEAQVAARAWATDNVFVDRSAEPDLATRPSWTLGYSFADVWSLGYSGQLAAFLKHPDLFSHWHEAYAYANPAWGAEGQNELVFELSAETLRNTNAYASINVVRPAALARVVLEPTSWLRWNFELEGSYRWFYDDPSTDSLDGFALTHFAFSLPSRTTLMPRVRFGARQFLRTVSGVSDNADQQLDAGMRIGQGLWPRAGLQVEYERRWAFGSSGFLARKTMLDTFQFLGEDFLYSGQRGHVALKQLIGAGWTIRLSCMLDERLFDGWPALTLTGTQTGESRRDRRVVPSLAVTYLYEGSETSWIRQVDVSADVSRTWQWSNSDWYNAASAQGRLDVRVTW